MSSNAATSFDSAVDPFFPDDVDDAFRGRILAALRDVRARERRASSPDLRAELRSGLRLGDAANDG